MSKLSVPEFIAHRVARTPEVRADTSRAYAERLAQTIMMRWHALGHYGVDAWVETNTVQLTNKKNPDIRSFECHAIKSNLVNGLPPAAKAIAA